MYLSMYLILPGFPVEETAPPLRTVWPEAVLQAEALHLLHCLLREAAAPEGKNSPGGTDTHLEVTTHT